MRKRFFTMLAALGGLVCANAADVTNYAELKAALGGGDTEIRMAVGLYIIADGAPLEIPAGKTVIGGFKNNFAERIYPGAAAKAADMTILDGNSLQNTAPADKHRVADVYGTLEGVVIRNGHAHNDNGGGVLVDGGTVLNCIIKGNVAMNPATNDAKGGGAYLQNSGKLINCVVAYNMANNGYGIAGTGDVINNTITANTYAPTAVAITGGSYQHYAHFRDVNSLPDVTDLDPQTITISDFNIAETPTTTSQYAVFAAAMDLSSVANPTAGLDVSFAVATKLSDLNDPAHGDNVGDYFGGMTGETGTEVLFQAGANTAGYGLQLVGQDYIYYTNGTNPTRSNEAMTYVTWYGALAYSLWLGGSLPTEGQWEYAARYNGSGLDNTLYAGSDILNDVAWNSGNSGGHVKDVAGKTANGAGLFDMSGNVWEWCADFGNVTVAVGAYPTYTYGTGTTDPIWNTPGSISQRTGRGGSYSSNIGDSTLAYRITRISSHVANTFGFRSVWFHN